MLLRDISAIHIHLTYSLAALRRHTATHDDATTGTITGGLATLICAYLVRLQRQNERVLKDLYEDDFVLAWSQPTPAVHAAATLVQASFRRDNNICDDAIAFHATADRAMSRMEFRVSLLLIHYDIFSCAQA